MFGHGRHAGCGRRAGRGRGAGRGRCTAGAPVVVRRFTAVLVVAGAIAAATSLAAVTATAGGAAQEPDRDATGRRESGARFVEIGEESGIDFRHVYGGPEKAYITEMGGSGAAWVDYDVDGHPDAFLVNGVPGPGERPWTAGRSGGREAPGRSRVDGAGGRHATAVLGHRLYRNAARNADRNARDAADRAFEDRTAPAGVGDVAWGNGAAVADVDNDGFPDLFVTAIGADRLYRNNGDGTLSPRSAGVEDEGWGTTAVFVDANADGLLDLYVVRYVDFEPDDTPTLGDGVCFYRGVEVFCGPEGLRGAKDLFYRSRGDGSFEPWPGIGVDDEATYGFAAVATDCDDDLRPELYVASDSTINLLYRLIGDAGSLRIEDLSLFGGAGYSGGGREQAGMGVTAADYDADGDLDLFVTNFQNDYNTLYRNLGDCLFEDFTERLQLASSSLPYMGWAPLFLDADGDGDPDLFVANGHIYPQLDSAGLESYGQRNLYYRNLLREEGAARFEESGEVAGPALREARSSRGAVSGDYDADGDLDLLVTNIDDRPSLLRNDGRMASPALSLKLVGRQASRTAYGADVVVESGGVTQRHEVRGSDGYLGTNDPRLLVFLPGGRAERLIVRWPGGDSTVLEDVGPGRLVVDQAGGVVAQAPWTPQR